MPKLVRSIRDHLCEDSLDESAMDYLKAAGEVFYNPPPKLKKSDLPAEVGKSLELKNFVRQFRGLAGKFDLQAREPVEPSEELVEPRERPAPRRHAPLTAAIAH